MALLPEGRPKLPLPQVREALGFSVHGITSYPDMGGWEEKGGREREEGGKEGGEKRKKEKHKKKDGSDCCEEEAMR